MSASQIIEELPKLSAAELRAIRERATFLEREHEETGTVGDLVALLRQMPRDTEWLQTMEEVYRELRSEPARNPWD